MQMPGRNGHVAGSGSYTPTTNSTSIPDEDLTVNNRISDRPAVYEAANSITFIPDFTSGVGDVFEARILVDPAAASSGGGAWVSGVGSGGYRYGFNGKENDNEAGEGIQDYGMRIYSERLGKFLSVDPITKKYPELTPYQFASNTPIQAIDLDGLEKYIMTYKVVDGKDVVLNFVTDNSLKYLATPSIMGVPTLKPKVVQYIKQDENGKVLSTTGDIPLKNLGSTIYAGNFNPKYGKEDGSKSGQDRYDYPAINSLDAAAKKHDKAYDDLQSKGFSGAIIDLKTINADIQLVKDATSVVALFGSFQQDPVNHKLVSFETVKAANSVIIAFSAIIIEKTIRIGINEAKEAVKKQVNQ